jgi:hypothetical protein
VEGLVAERRVVEDGVLHVRGGDPLGVARGPGLLVALEEVLYDLRFK